MSQFDHNFSVRKVPLKITYCAILLIAALSNMCAANENPHFPAQTTTYTRTTEWSDSIQRLIGLLQGLLQKINAGYYAPPYNTEQVPLWIRSQIDELYRYRKKALTKVKRQRIVSLTQATISYVQHLQGLINTHFIELPTLAIETVALTNFPDETSDLKQLSQELDGLEELINACGITTINKIARTIEKMTDWLDSYTHIYAWWSYSHFLPAGLIGLRHILPEPLRDIIDENLYNGHAPHWKCELDAYWYIPKVRITAPRKNFYGLGAAERYYEIFIKAYLVLQLTKRYILDDKTRQLLDAIPNNTFIKAKEWWSTLKGIPPNPSENHSNVVYDIDFDDEGLIGLEQQKEQVSDIISYMLDPEGYVSRGHMIQKGVLFIGPSRTGKTIFARALAGTINKYFRQDGKKTELKFIELTYDSINKLDSPEAFERLIEETRSQAPCILFRVLPRINKKYILGTCLNTAN